LSYEQLAVVFEKMAVRAQDRENDESNPAAPPSSETRRLG
jgi:hypothetical protein